MLKGLDPYLTPDLLRALAIMGHCDRFALVDRNFPAYANGSPVIQLPHSTIADVLSAIVQVFPLEQYPNDPIIHMLTDDGEDGPALAAVRQICDEAEGREVEFKGVLRHGKNGFYALAKKANLTVTVQTGETLPYACYLIPKGVIAAN